MAKYYIRDWLNNFQVGIAYDLKGAAEIATTYINSVTVLTDVEIETEDSAYRRECLNMSTDTVRYTIC